MKPVLDNLFAQQLRVSIRAYVRRARADGVVAMSRANLLQVVRPPSPAVPGAPAGSNAPYHYREMFNDIIDNDSSLNRFANLN